MVIGRRANGSIGTSVSRTATLPAMISSQLDESARWNNEPVIRLNHKKELHCVTYRPDLLWRLRERPRRISSKYHFRTFPETFFQLTLQGQKTESAYEKIKTEQLFSLIPFNGPKKVLQITLAQNSLTQELTMRSDSLTVLCLTQAAAERGNHSNHNLENVRYASLDCNRVISEKFDLIVCTDVLYFPSKELTEILIQKLATALNTNGHLVSVHSNLVVDDSDKPGLDWPLSRGARKIGTLLSQCSELQLQSEIRHTFYRIQVFGPRKSFANIFRRPKILEVTTPDLPPSLTCNALPQGGSPKQLPIVTKELPILLFHSISSENSLNERYRLTPESLEGRLRYLYEQGYYSVTLESWEQAIKRHEPLPGRALILTFDDGYLDFYTHAWPVVKRYGFTAYVFLVTDRIGQMNQWDKHLGGDISLLNWETIDKLKKEGVYFGSHTASHRRLTSISPSEVVAEAVHSRIVLEKALDQPVTCIAYPHGAEDEMVNHLVGACGYVYGLSCRPGFSTFQDPLLALRRLEVNGTDTLEQFATKLKS
jgi:peptidoglycan/xylan/chitin deacetylase (PgdA/CDA1 family)